MMEIKETENKPKKTQKWHIVIIMIFIFVLSVLSWKASYVSVRNALRCGDENKGPDEVKEILESEWTVYGKGNFSKADTIWTYYVMHEIPSVQVILGTNGWLFYKSVNDGDCVADYEGTNLFTEDELTDITARAISVQNIFAEKGMDFIIFIPPNKGQVYPEYVPDTYVQAKESRADILADTLNEAGVTVVSPKENLIGAKENGYQLYYSYDTHWNLLGGYIGTQAILNEIGIEPCPSVTISETMLRDGYHYGADEDLARMAGLRFLFNDDTEYLIDETPLTDWAAYADDQNNGRPSYYENDSALCDKTVVLIGDSFRSAMVPSLRQAFAGVYIIDIESYDVNIIDEICPDIVIYEFVERKVGDIKTIDLIGY